MDDALARALAAASLSGDWSPAGFVATGSGVLGGRRPRWLRDLAAQVHDLYPRAPLDRPRELAANLARLPAAEKAGRSRAVVQPTVVTRMVQNPWRLPELHDLADLAAYLDVSPAELDWFADPRHLTRSATDRPLWHYRVSHRPTASGAVRVLEAPKARLKAVQRRLLDDLLVHVPLHDAARGFRPGGSVQSYAAPHAGRPVVVRLDLEAFFASVSVSRVFGTWRTAGYPEPVAHRLAGLVTCVLPRAAWRDVPRPSDDGLLDAHWRLGRRLAVPHLPQGAPTSPALANLAAYRLDVRLTALVESWGGRYTRYADDLALSGPAGWRRGTRRLLDAVADVVRDEGFALNARKTGVMPSAGRQVLGGLVVNDRPRVSRAEVDRLRAVLHNCRHHGAASQNHADVPRWREHLLGRVAWVAQHDPERGARLRAQHEAVDWDT